MKLSKREALKALEEDAEDQRVVLDEALVILGDLPALWTSLDDHGKQAWVQGALPEAGDQPPRKSG